ncbi:MAG: hypothetical protein ABL957_08390 [Parvularculaceae bacterium]
MRFRAAFAGGLFALVTCGFGGVFNIALSVSLNFFSSEFVAMAVDFKGPRLKLKRADHHIGDLETIFSRYVDKNREGFRANRNNPSQTRQFGQDFPEDMPTILGDAIHNLRVTLDHAYFLLTVSPDHRTMFPFSKDRPSLVGSINGQTSKPRQDIVDFIVNNIQPYAGGQLSFYDLHRLDITDKHATILPTPRVMRVQRLDLLDPNGGPGNVMRNVAIVTPHGQDITALSVQGAAAQLYDNPQSVFDILFGPGPLENESILRTLNTLRDNVFGALEALEKIA